MERTSFEAMSCSVARTLDVIGERWTPLVIRDLYLGISRFDAIQRNLGVSRKVLTQRLAKLADHGVIERFAYQDNPPRYDYRLTPKGQELVVVLLAMKAWGDHWAVGDSGPPLLLRHRCGAITDPIPTCSGCGEPLHLHDVTPLAGPGAQPGPGTSEIPAALARLQGASSPAPARRTTALTLRQR